MFSYNIDQEKMCNIKDGFTDDLFGKGIAKIKSLDLQNVVFYFVKNAYEVEEIANGVIETGNPVILFLKTKEKYDINIKYYNIILKN